MKTPRLTKVEKLVEELLPAVKKTLEVCAARDVNFLQGQKDILERMKKVLDSTETYHIINEEEPNIVECSECETVFSLTVHEQCPACGSAERIPMSEVDRAVLDERNRLARKFLETVKLKPNMKLKNGATIILFKPNDEGGTVLCVRDSGEFVTWKVDKKGNTFHGHYTCDLWNAQIEFTHRY